MLIYKNINDDKISNRILCELSKQHISKSRFSKMCGVSRDTIIRYTNSNTKEYAMDVKILKIIEIKLGLEEYSLCLEYHKFLDCVNGAKWIKNKRLSYGMTQKDFSEKLHTSLSLYKGYEGGLINIPYDIWIKGSL